MTQADFIRQQQECRASMLALAKLYPGAFTADGKPIVAVARLVTPTKGAASPNTGEAK